MILVAAVEIRVQSVLARLVRGRSLIARLGSQPPFVLDAPTLPVSRTDLEAVLTILDRKEGVDPYLNED